MGENRRKLEVASEVEKIEEHEIRTPSRVKPIPKTGSMQPQYPGGMSIEALKLIENSTQTNFPEKVEDDTKKIKFKEESTQTNFLEHTGRDVATQTPKEGIRLLHTISIQKCNKILIGVPRRLTNIRKKATRQERTNSIYVQANKVPKQLPKQGTNTRGSVPDDGGERCAHRKQEASIGHPR